jgi:TRAP-type C4-dicarboxylate transport system permease small subunit
MSHLRQLNRHIKYCRNNLNRVFAAIGGAAVASLTLVTVIAVFYRYVLNDPIYGLDDLSSILLLVCVAGAIAFGAGTRAHVSVDILSKLASRRVTWFADIVVRAIGVGILGLSSWALYKEAQCGVACGYFTPNLMIHHKPFYWLMALSLGWYAVVLVLEIIDHVVNFEVTKVNGAHE